jgi:hypothetical protein
MRFLISIRGATSRPITSPAFLLPLCMAYGDFAAGVFFAHIDELLRIHKDPRKVATFFNPVFYTVIEFVLPMWSGSGAKPGYEREFIDTAYRTIKASSAYRLLMVQIAESATDESAQVGSFESKVTEAGPRSQQSDARPEPLSAAVESSDRFKHELAPLEKGPAEMKRAPASEPDDATGNPRRKKRGRPTGIPGRTQTPGLRGPW